MDTERFVPDDICIIAISNQHLFYVTLEEAKRVQNILSELNSREKSITTFIEFKDISETTHNIRALDIDRIQYYSAGSAEKIHRVNKEISERMQAAHDKVYHKVTDRPDSDWDFKR